MSHVASIATLSAALATACWPSPPPAAPQHLAAIQSASVYDRAKWSYSLSAPVDQTVVMTEGGGGELRLDWSDSAAGAAPIRATYLSDVTNLRARRLKVSIVVKAATATSASPNVRLEVISRSNGEPSLTSYKEVKAKALERQVSVILDTSKSTRELAINLELREPGDVVFSSLSIDDVTNHDDSTHELSSIETARLVEVTRLLSVVRYFYPGREAASADWESTMTEAVFEVLSSTDDASYRRAIASVLHEVAPAATIGDKPAPVTDSLQLTRWIHIGVGDAPPYMAFRPGIDADPGTYIGVRRAVDAQALSRLSGCKAVDATLVSASATEAIVSVTLNGRTAAGETVTLRQDAQSGRATASLARTTNLVELRVGARMTGIEGSASFVDVELLCDGVLFERFSLATGLEEVYGRGYSQYTTEISQCGGRACRTIQGTAGRDPMVAEELVAFRLRDGETIWIPTAISKESAREQEYSTGRLPEWRARPVLDLPMRIATVAVLWSALAQFYPYHSVVGTRWDEQLGPALTAVARAPDGATLTRTLRKLVASLKDNHAVVLSAGQPQDGVLPIMLREFGKEIVVTGVIPSYATVAPVGSVVKSVNGQDADARVEELRAESSAASAGWEGYVLPANLTYGAKGTFADLVIESADGHDGHIVLPYLDRDVADSIVRERRPKTGTEIAPGVLYVDLESLDKKIWLELVNAGALERATAVVYDVRGYISNVAFDVLGHYTSQVLMSPRFLLPIVRPQGPVQYEESRWPVLPRMPKAAGRAIFVQDGRSGSADETLLQMVRDYKLGVIVGEPSAGTNGNRARVSLPGGYVLYFTAMQVRNEAGQLTHMQSIQPDLLVHATRKGVETHRDELLEAAISIAQMKGDK